MDIRLRPEIEAMIRKNVERGPYKTPEEVIERAISEFHEREEWLFQHRDEIAQKIEEGWQSAQEGRLMDAEEVEAAMEIRKKAWLEKNHKPKSGDS
jgi:Arc/MetJ-type ribon-helix-helix transcriptional regulator